MANVLILGATSAIATQVAHRYAARGDRLFLVGRSPDKLAALVEALGDAVVGSQAVDLTATEGHPALVTAAVDALGGLDIALMCHGLLTDQLQTEASFEAARPVLEVNFVSVVSLCIPLANVLEAQGHGHLAVITSVAGDRGRPRNFTYGAAKAGVNTYLEGLRSRLYSAGVQVHTLKVGPTDTPMTVDHEKTAMFSTPDKVADGIVTAIDRGRSVAYIPGFWRLIMMIVRNLPAFIFQRIGSLSGR